MWGVAATLRSKIVYSLRGVWITRRATVTHREFKELQVCEGTNFPSLVPEYYYTLSRPIWTGYCD